MHFVQESLQENSCGVRDVKLLLPYICCKGLVPGEGVHAFQAEGSLNSPYISPPAGLGYQKPFFTHGIAGIIRIREDPEFDFSPPIFHFPLPFGHSNYPNG